MNQKILVIIRNTQIGERISDYLKTKNFSVKICPEAKEAISSVKGFGPDLIICDDYMPSISGQELARLFKSNKSLEKIPFILLTARIPSLQEIERGGYKVIADDLIQLPLTEQNLQDIIEKWLKAKSRPPSIAEKIAGPLSNHRMPKAVKPWNKGRVNCVTAGRLLYNIIHNKDSGILRIKGDRRMIKAFFHEGELVEVKSNYIRDDTLGRLLIIDKKITSKENEMSLKTATQRKVPQGRILVQMKLLKEFELEKYIGEQKANKISNIFGPQWHKAAFEFASEKIDESYFGMDPIPLHRILRSGILDIAEPGELLDTFTRNKKQDTPLRIDAQLESIMKEIGLDVLYLEQIRLFEDLNVNQVKQKYPEEFEGLLRLVFLLIVTKGVRLGEEKKAPVPKAKKTPPKTITEKLPEQPATWDSEFYHNNLAEARTLFNRGDHRKAIPLLEKAISMNSDSAEAIAMLAWANFELTGKDNIAVTFESKEMLKKAISIDDNCDIALLFLGKILKQEGKDSLAGTYFRRAHKLNPASEEARREVKLLQMRNRRAKDLGFR